MSMPPLGNKGPHLSRGVARELEKFGLNPAGKPIFRIVWSEDKLQRMEDGELIQEYDNDPPQWILEKWLSPEQFAGSPIIYEMNRLIGTGPKEPYPTEGYYMAVWPQPFVAGLEISRTVVKLLCKVLEQGKTYTQWEIKNSIREREAKKRADARTKMLEAAVETLDSACLGKIQQPASGPKNNFRTPEDWERDQKLTTRDIGREDHAGLRQY